jgi:hypothetical protein
MSLRPLLQQLREVCLQEMPIRGWKPIGKFDKGHGFSDPIDRKLLTSPGAVEKIHRQWEKTPYDFDIYLVNKRGIGSGNTQEVGEVDLDFVRNVLKLSPTEVPDPAEDVITVLFTNNKGDQRYMATGWILAHRLGHAFARKDGRAGQGTVGAEWQWVSRELERIFSDILRDVYGVSPKREPYGEYTGSAKEKVLRLAAMQLGTMKSARDSALRNWFEFGYELLAQYMLTGRVKLNPLPERIVVGSGGWGRKETRGVVDQDAWQAHNDGLMSDGLLREYEEEIQNMLEGVLARAVGRIFVM